MDTEQPERTGHTEMLRQRLKAAREDLGLTQDQVAKRVTERLGKSIGASAVSNWENMVRQPGVDEFAAWARAVRMRLIVELDAGGSTRLGVLVERRHAELVKAIDRLPIEHIEILEALVTELHRIPKK